MELLRDLVEPLLRGLIAHRGGPGNHSQCLELAEVRNQGLRHAIGEVLLIGVARKILKWQNGQRSNLWRAGAAEQPVTPTPGVQSRQAYCGRQESGHRVYDPFLNAAQEGNLYGQGYISRRGRLQAVQIHEKLFG